MTKSFDQYTHLAGGHGRRGSLWRGPDHLLVVEGGGVLFALTESYRRIDYANIQALTLARTSRYAWIIAACVAPMVLALFILMLMGLAEASGNTVLGTMLVLGVPLVIVPGVVLIIHLVKGRTVRCTLQTAVQNLRLRALTREGTAQPVLDELARICREHQGAMPEASSAPPLPQNAAPMAPPPGLRPLWNGSPAVLAAGLSVLTWGLMLAGELFVSGLAYFALHGFVVSVATILAIVALIIALRHESPTALRASLWATSALGLFAGFVALAGFGAAAAHMEATQGASGPIGAVRFLADFSMAQTGAFGWIIVGIGAIIAVLGLAMLPHAPRKTAAPQRSMPVPPL